MRALREQQRAAREQQGLQTTIANGDALEIALASAERREREAVLRGDLVFSPPFFKYPVRTERLRWARTRDILQRTSPGPDEDGVYLEMIARQAASIEVILRQEHTDHANLRCQQICDRLLLATLPVLDSSACARRHGDFYFVQISAGLIEFAYQASKAVVLSWKPVPAAAGAAFSFKCEPDDVQEVLAANPMPLMLLRMTIENYLFNGLPRAVGYSPPPSNYQAPLTLLTASNERFVIAHEYCHTLHDALDIVHGGNSMHSEEFASDVLAFHLVAESGHQLDLLPPNLSTQGVYFVLTVLDILRQALDLVRFGAARNDQPFVGYPPISQRLQVLRECYRKTVTTEDNDDSIRAALFPANTLSLLWKRLLDDGLAASWRGRTLSRVWEGI